MTERIEARRAGDDLSEVAALQAGAFAQPWTVESLQWELANNPAARLYVLERDGRLVAYCACWVLFDELHINSLAVALPERRQGTGARFMREVMRRAYAEGARTAFLEVRRSNQAALALYASLGFVIDGVRKDYYEHPREDALLLRCVPLADV